MGTSGQAQTVCSSEGQGQDSSKKEMVAGEKNNRFHRLLFIPKIDYMKRNIFCLPRTRLSFKNLSLIYCKVNHLAYFT